MATITIFENVTLDGVMQAPGRPDEDTRDGFVHGGWADGFADEVSMREAGKNMAASTGLLFGRRTYQDVLGFWTSTPGPNPFVETLLNAPKYVVSHDAHAVLDYPNSTLLAGDGVASVAKLRDDIDGALTVLGSGELVRALHAAGLVDRYVLHIHPLVLGSGTELFERGPGTSSEIARLTLLESTPTTTGVIIATYARA